MTRLWVDGFPLQVQTNSRDQPAIFQLNGRRYVVEQVVQQWEVDTDWWTEQGRVWRRHYAVTTRGDGLFCVISYDVLKDEWRLERVYD
jgi:hypothetical protein